MLYLYGLYDLQGCIKPDLSHDTIKYVINYEQKYDYIFILSSFINFTRYILITLDGES